MNDDFNICTVQRDGPNMITGDLTIVTAFRARRMKTAVLCRCGHSSDQPYCDGMHVKIGFTDPGRLPADAHPGSVREGRLTITPQSKGPNRCEGPLLIRGTDGRASAAELTLLCRCGASSNKPYCDGTHEGIDRPA